MQETWLDPQGQKFPGKKWQPTPNVLPENPKDRAAWWATIHVATKSPEPNSDQTTTRGVDKS